MAFPITPLHEVAAGDDGLVRGARVQVQAAGRIEVWTGMVDAGVAKAGTATLEASDFRERAVVHFIDWEQACAYYRDTPFAGLVDALRHRVLRMSTLPRSDAPHPPP